VPRGSGAHTRAVKQILELVFACAQAAPARRSALALLLSITCQEREAPTQLESDDEGGAGREAGGRGGEEETQRGGGEERAEKARQSASAEACKVVADVFPSRSAGYPRNGHALRILPLGADERDGESFRNNKGDLLPALVPQHVIAAWSKSAVSAAVCAALVPLIAHLTKLPPPPWSSEAPASHGGAGSEADDAREQARDAAREHAQAVEAWSGVRYLSVRLSVHPSIHPSKQPSISNTRAGRRARERGGLQ